MNAPPPCIDCAHRERSLLLLISPQYARCLASPRQPTDGEPSWSCEQYRKPTWPCGPDGVLFKPRGSK